MYSWIFYRSSRTEMFYKKAVPWNFGKFTEKQLCWILFFNKKRDWDSNTSRSLWVLQNFTIHPFYRTPLRDCFDSISVLKTSVAKQKIFKDTLTCFSLHSWNRKVHMLIYQSVQTPQQMRQKPNQFVHWTLKKKN